MAIKKRFITNDEINDRSASALLNLHVKNKDTHLSLKRLKLGQKLTDC